MTPSVDSWDAMTESLVNFADKSSYIALPAEVVYECKRRVIDTFASALGAFAQPASVMARAVAARSRTDRPASIWGSTIKTTPEAAAFANGVMVRVLDISDTYLGKSRGHPSDMTSGILAVAESTHADGRSVIAAITLAYDVYCSFCQAIDINAKGWDQPVYGVLGCVIGIGKLLGFSRAKMANAISLALAPNMALAQSRRGELSNWKGCAGANASRNAVFAAMLAEDGFTGPTAVFEGDGGLWEVIGRQQWTLPEAIHMITHTSMKSLPICYHGQSAVLAALQLRDRAPVSEIEEICVDTYKTGVMMMGADPSRWAPTTRETADHSMPYVVAMALLDGAVTDASFSDERLADRAVAQLMAKVKVKGDDRLTGLYPEASPGRVSIRTKAGKSHSAEVIYPLGHMKNPLSDREVEKKFHDMTSAMLSAGQREIALKTLWNIEQAGDISDVITMISS